jgi:hypothetical protein
MFVDSTKPVDELTIVNCPYVTINANVKKLILYNKVKLSVKTTFYVESIVFHNQTVDIEYLHSFDRLTSVEFYSCIITNSQHLSTFDFSEISVSNTDIDLSDVVRETSLTLIGYSNVYIYQLLGARESSKITIVGNSDLVINAVSGFIGCLIFKNCSDVNVNLSCDRIEFIECNQVTFGSGTTFDFISIRNCSIKTIDLPNVLVECCIIDCPLLTKITGDVIPGNLVICDCGLLTEADTNAHDFYGCPWFDPSPVRESMLVVCQRTVKKYLFRKRLTKSHALRKLLPGDLVSHILKF